MLGRRRFAVLGSYLALSAGAFALGCKRAAALPSSCEDTSGLSDDERAARTALAYTDRAPAPEKACRSCQQWVAPRDDGACGGCKLLKGPVHPVGTCKAFAPKS